MGMKNSRGLDRWQERELRSIHRQHSPDGQVSKNEQEKSVGHDEWKETATPSSERPSSESSRVCAEMVPKTEKAWKSLSQVDARRYRSLQLFHGVRLSIKSRRRLPLCPFADSSVCISPSLAIHLPLGLRLWGMSYASWSSLWDRGGYGSIRNSLRYAIPSSFLAEFDFRFSHLKQRQNQYLT